MSKKQSAFDEWFSSQAGFNYLPERSTVLVGWLKAAFVAGVVSERNRCAEVADEQRARCISEGDKRPNAVYEWRLAAGKAGEIATSIRNPDGYLNRS